MIIMPVEGGGGGCVLRRGGGLLLGWLLEIYAEFFLERSNQIQVSFVNSSHETAE